MGFRTVLINSRGKLETKMNYLVFKGEETKRIFLNEISTLIIQSTAVVVTTALLCELIKNKVKVIFCDEKHNPQSELVSYYGAHNSSKKLRMQSKWADNKKQLVWTKNIQQKIRNQGMLLKHFGFLGEANALFKYAEEVELNDKTNREGHAAKLYFKTLFGEKWHRDCGDFWSVALNYGYTILLSAFNREIVKDGYVTQLGIWHDNQFNYFNLSCDLMEPFRVLIDKIVYQMEENDENFKRKLIGVFEQKILINKKRMFVDDAIGIYIKSIFDFLNGKGKMSIDQFNFVKEE